jgi:hypothetical protein
VNSPTFLDIDPKKVDFFIFVHLMQKGGLNEKEDNFQVCSVLLHIIVVHGS